MQHLFDTHSIYERRNLKIGQDMYNGLCCLSNGYALFENASLYMNVEKMQKLVGLLDEISITTEKIYDLFKSEIHKASKQGLDEVGEKLW